METQRQQRANQIRDKFPYERIEQPRQSFWMHSISKHEVHGELEKAALLLVGGFVIICAVLYFMAGK
jgi:hypothetical protein